MSIIRYVNGVGVLYRAIYADPEIGISLLPVQLCRFRQEPQENPASFANSTLSQDFGSTHIHT